MTSSTTADASPFARGAQQLLDLGYSPIPLLPRDKAPGERVNGRWKGMSDWPRFRDTPASAFDLRVWSGWADANIGVVLGTAIGEHKLIAVDVDAPDEDVVAEIRAACPASPMVKRGAKGMTLFYRGPTEIRSRGYNIAGKRVVDLLTGSQTRQTVMPPSVHPYGPTYQWLSGPVAATELPLFDETALERLEDTLQHLGWGGEVADQPRASRRPLETRDDDPTIWEETNAAALQNLEAWVPALDLYGCRGTRRGGFEAVATWRPSSTGQPLEKRKRNLQIHPDGIRDFGADVGYSALDLICAATSWSFDDAFKWLRDKLGLSSDPAFTPPPAPPVVLEKPDGSLVEMRTGREVALSAIASPELPDRLTRVDGLVGELTEYIVASARRPQRGLALAAALTLVGTAAGRKYAGPTRSGTHLYVLGLARTGAGKDHPLQMIYRIMTAAGMTSEIGPSQFMSMSAVVRLLGRSPLTLCAMDEFGAFLTRINARKAATHERAISGILRQAWSASFSTMTTPEWAGEASRTIHSPALSIYGASTHEEFYQALQGGDIHNGFLNRFLLVTTRTRPKEVEPTADAHVMPAVLEQQLRTIHTIDGPLLTATSHNGRAESPGRVVKWGSPSAQAAYMAFNQSLDAREEEAPFLSRTAEMALRVATIVAVGRSPESPELTEADFMLGRDLAAWSADRMIAEAGAYMAENDRQADYQLVLRAVREKQVISRTELMRRLNGRMDKRSLDNALALMVEAGQVHTQLRVPSNGGRASTTYVYGPEPEPEPA